MQAFAARLAPFSIVAAASAPRCVPSGQLTLRQISRLYGLSAWQSEIDMLRPIVDIYLGD